MFRNLQYIPNDPARRFTFEAYEIDLSILNAFRRIILTNIPVIGFDGEDTPSLEVIENTGPLHNEYILQRFGCIPVHLNESDIDTFESDDYLFELNVKNTEATMLNVTTHNFTVLKKEKALSHKEVLALFPNDIISKEPLLITRLRQGEHLHVKGKAVRRTAHQHGGFTPALATLRFMQDPAVAIQSLGILDRERAYIKNDYGDPTTIIFEIESFSSLTPKYLILKSIEILMNKLHTTIQEIYNPESEKVKITLKENDEGAEFLFTNEDDTLGNFLQSLMHNHYIRDKKPTSQNRTLSYVGYFCPHPLEETMVLRITFNKDDDTDTIDTTDTTNATNESNVPKTKLKSNDSAIKEIEYMDVLKEHCVRSLAYLQELQNAWLEQNKE
jgi:DNA-directed RNA polymerase subunit L